MICVLAFEVASEAWQTSGQWDDNRLRGALGKALRQVSCVARAPTCDGCPARSLCAYGYCFETEAQQEGRFLTPGQEAPRPYVMRQGRVLDDETGAAFELVLLGRATRLVPYFVLAAKGWETPGMGFGDGPVTLRSVHALHPFDERTQTLYKAGDGRLQTVPWQVTQDDLDAAVGRGLVPRRPSPSRGSALQGAIAVVAEALAVDFLTPTRLKFRGEQLRHSPPFHALIANLLRRLEGLRTCHDLTFEVGDVRELIAQSDAIQLTAWQGHSERRGRYSFRQHQRMEWEGFVGRATYRGDLTPFRRLLKLGELIHVGKGAVFGLGRMRLGVTDDKEAGA